MTVISGARRRRPLHMLVVGVLALALVGCSNAKDAKDDSPAQSANTPAPVVPSEVPPAGDLTVKWSVPANDSPRNAVFGRWITKDALYVGTWTDGLVRYSASDGKAEAVPLPGPEPRICGMSTSASETLAAVAWGAGDTCSNVGLVDLTTGKLRFTVPFTLLWNDGRPGRTLRYGTTMQLVVTDHMVVAAGDGDVHTYDIADGKLRWSWSAKAIGLEQAFTTGALADNSTVLVSVWPMDAQRAGWGASLDAATGAMRWGGPVVPRGAERISAVSLDPPAFSVLHTKGLARSIVVVDDKGRPKRTIEVNKPDDPDASPETFRLGRSQEESLLHVAAGVFYTRTEIGRGKDERVGVKAVDLKTGATKWTTPLPGKEDDYHSLLDLRVIDAGPAGVHVLQIGDSYDKEPFTVWWLSPQDGTWRKWASGPSPDKVFEGYSLWYAWFDGGIYLTSTSISPGQPIAVRIADAARPPV
ncbi:PQQ-binding-like beta-propeller repeat protein [Yinghuangia soli]|uniref:PQQ-binding-like beta-propeller repeat protein n=1 Tax=Yinghuangia soli TaxID=2908204 RepID=A0AA41U4Q4_9ACTN|nr:PQQ-binding-like beta-propeller repeat protein [Yinghuangia soli]MCF2533190.1 PQQ-binding-like beta-propeller repeat protein [Yinghuangia soli]